MRLEGDKDGFSGCDAATKSSPVTKAHPRGNRCTDLHAKQSFKLICACSNCFPDEVGWEDESFPETS